MKKNSKNGGITLEGLADKIDKVSDNLDTLTIMTAKGFDGVDKRFEQVDKGFENIDSSFNREIRQVKKRVDKLEDAVVFARR